MKLSIQLYSLRGESEKDFPGVLEFVSKQGFSGVEFAGFYGLSAQEVKSQLDRLGLVCSGTHTPWNEVLEHPEETITFSHVIGNRYVVIPGYEMHSRADVLALAAKIRDVKPLYDAAGITIGYHNHEAEFVKDGGEYLLDILAAETPGLILELDTYWSSVAGVNTPAYMRKYHDRMPLIHLKDGDGKQLASIGEGNRDIAAVLDAAQDIGVEWVVYENDEPVPTGFADAERTRRVLTDQFGF